MKRMTFTAEPGEVLTLKLPVVAEGFFFSRREVTFELMLEVRAIHDGKVDLIVIGPSGGDE